MTKEEHILVLIMEECAEVSHRASKALRFGLDEIQKDQEWTNKQRLLQEFNDLMGIMKMFSGNTLSDIINYSQIDEKIAKVERWMKYSQQHKTLE